MRTQVGIVGAGPAGLLLSHLLHLEGIESVVLEDRSREYVEQRVRAGVLEQGTVDLLNETGVGERMRREGLQHRGVNLRFNGHTHHVDFVDLVGRGITIYGQQEVVKDLIAARLAAGGRILFDVPEVTLLDLTGESPAIRFRDGEGADHELVCDFIAGCDGSHGVSRPSVPPGVLTVYERVYPLAWLGILAQSRPVSEELIYVHHQRGFALFSMRTPEITRLYLQCTPDEDLGDWPDERVWEELQARLGEENGAAFLTVGSILQKGVTPMRSYVVEPMRYGRLFLAGDAAHVVPPTGAKGMNLAIADVCVLSRALAAFYRSGHWEGLDRYSETCLRRVWKAQRFSTWMTNTLHRFDHHSEFDRHIQLAELDYVTSSRFAAQSFAENYVGLPMD